MYFYRKVSWSLRYICFELLVGEISRNFLFEIRSGSVTTPTCWSRIREVAVLVALSFCADPVADIWQDDVAIWTQHPSVRSRGIRTTLQYSCWWCRSWRR
jgi:hypothetical protein